MSKRKWEPVEPWRWSNLQSARPLCKHSVEEIFADMRADRNQFGVEEFIEEMKKAFASLWAPGAKCDCAPHIPPSDPPRIPCVVK